MIQVICMQENNRSQKQKIQISIIIAITMKEKIKPRKGENLKSMSEIKMKWDCTGLFFRFKDGMTSFLIRIFT